MSIEFDRRELILKGVGAFALGALGLDRFIVGNTLSAANAQTQRGRLPMLQLASTEDQVQIKVLRSAGMSFIYRVRQLRENGATATAVISDDWIQPSVVFSPQSGLFTDVVDHLFVESLNPDTQFCELLVLDSRTGQILDQRFFRALRDRDLSTESLRVAFLSCLNDRYVDGQRAMWASVQSSRPDLMIWNGDLCYLDQRWDGSLDGLWGRHITTRKMLDVFYWKTLVPTLCGWDDHDTAENDSDALNPLLGVSTDYFRAFFGSAPVRGWAGRSDRLYRLDLSGLRFIFLDSRSEKMHEQIYSSSTLSWLERELRSASGPVFLINGTQFFGAYLLGGESIEKSSPWQLDQLMQMCRVAPVPVVFMSGDVHFSEVMAIEPKQLGYSTFELTSSAIHSRTIPGQQFRSLNPRRLQSTSWWNFMSLDISTRNRGQIIDMDLYCLGQSNSVFFHQPLSVEKR